LWSFGEYDYVDYLKDGTGNWWRWFEHFGYDLYFGYIFYEVVGKFYYGAGSILTCIGSVRRILESLG
jgi:hypothetical protein